MAKLNRCAARGIAPEQVCADLAALLQTHTTQHLGRRLNVSPSGICDVKNGKTPPGLKILQALYGQTGTTLRPDLLQHLPKGYAMKKSPDAAPSLPDLLAKLTAERDAAERALDELEGELQTLQSLIARHAGKEEE